MSAIFVGLSLKNTYTPPRKCFSAPLIFALLLSLAAGGFCSGAARAGSWVLFNYPTYVNNTSSMTTTNPSSGGPTYWNMSFMTSEPSYPQGVAMTGAESVDTFLLWVPQGDDPSLVWDYWNPGQDSPYKGDTGWQSDPPPAKAYIEASDDVEGDIQAGFGSPAPSGYGFSTTAFSVSDGDGDSMHYDPSWNFVNATGSEMHAASSGLHLGQEDGSSGIITMVANPSGQIDYTDEDPGEYVQGSLYYSYDYTQDTRGAAITSSLGQTYHKGPDDANGIPTIVPDAPASDGTVTATSVAPDGNPFDDPSITFTGIAIGNYGTNSVFNMYSSAKSYDNSGTFTGSGDATSFTNIYTDPSASQEHVHLDLVDSLDSAKAESDYYINFHPAIDDWHKVGSNTFPADFSTDPSAWTFVCEIDNDSAATPSGSASSAITLSDSYAATVGEQQSLSFAQAGTVEANEAVTLGQTVTLTITTTQTFQGAPWADIKYYTVEGGTDDYGTCDTYGGGGYYGQEPWTCVKTITNVPTMHVDTVGTYPH